MDFRLREQLNIIQDKLSIFNSSTENMFEVKLATKDLDELVKIAIEYLDFTFRKGIFFVCQGQFNAIYRILLSELENNNEIDTVAEELHRRLSFGSREELLDLGIKKSELRTGTNVLNLYIPKKNEDKELFELYNSSTEIIYDYGILNDKLTDEDSPYLAIQYDTFGIRVYPYEIVDGSLIIYHKNRVEIIDANNIRRNFFRGRDNFFYETYERKYMLAKEYGKAEDFIIMMKTRQFASRIAINKMESPQKDGARPVVLKI